MASYIMNNNIYQQLYFHGALITATREILKLIIILNNKLQNLFSSEAPLPKSYFPHLLHSK